MPDTKHGTRAGELGGAVILFVFCLGVAAVIGAGFWRLVQWVLG